MTESNPTEQEIQEWITSPKVILSTNPKHGFKDKNRYWRESRMILAGVASDGLRPDANGGEYDVFINQNTRFLENFSIGLLYKTEYSNMKTIPLVRYNGAHGETSRTRDGHYSRPHIHRINAAMIASGSILPELAIREITERYSTLTEAMNVFFTDIGVERYHSYLPKIPSDMLL